MHIDGERMRRLRYEVGMSQRELAERSNVVRQTINAMEANHSASIETIRAVANALGCRISDLLPTEAAIVAAYYPGGVG